MVTRCAAWRGFLISSVCGILTALAIAPVTLAQSQRSPAPDQPLETVVVDPLQSPFPLPWKWIDDGHAAALKAKKSLRFTQQTPQYVSPDGRYVAQATLYFTADPEAQRQQLVSILEIRDRQSGSQQRIESLREMPREFLAEVRQGQGLIAVLVPVGWSETGNHLLVRQVGGLFATDLISDAAWIWQAGVGHVATVYPTADEYDFATLLGWSTTHPQRVLFQTQTMGNPKATIWAVDTQGSTQLAQGDRPRVYGTTLPATANAQR
ncbi:MULTISPECIES: hypothetical protein [unclassified Thermosynechococcus]|uniref:hypothetical protein n=1 Tax=unclassified Thermosynechococcus TaxID=2622553 RepID=UPI0019EBE035|nr:MULTISPECIES: hypothetical protein [unclassified Thermosynechococcus]HIK34651.1 hypothetical protein [Thermosynechococcus sp. M98_K2018_005]HIK49286.1 hypothetical protein [Thermosynechococcus sp. M55_K2018_012]